MQTQVLHLDPCAMSSSLAELRRCGILCDVILLAQGGQSVQAHKVCLAAASGYFRALFAGAGTAMREAHALQQSGQHMVHLADLDVDSIDVVVNAVYDRKVEVSNYCMA